EQEQVVAPDDELRERQLRLLASGQRRRVLKGLVTRQREHAQDASELLVSEAVADLLAHVVEHRTARRDALVFLGVVPDRPAVTEAHLARVGLARAGEDAQQTRLARTVESENEEALAAADVELHTVEDVERAVRLGQAGHLEDGATRGRWRRELEMQA